VYCFAAAEGDAAALPDAAADSDGAVDALGAVVERARGTQEAA